ncbi:MAG: low molecular weight protein arginine phosphatase [Opitutales bacterium]|jgi:protein-tyrosine-phosphatase
MGRKSRKKKEKRQEKLVVFICTANVCRSPMAEKLFEEALEKSSTQKKIRVFSAGLTAANGDKASENSCDAVKEIGLDLSDHRSSAATRPTLQNASAIFCMTESHRALMHMYFELPDDAPVFLMREFVEGAEDKELPDPFGQSLAVYRECRDKMVESLPSLLAWVENNL